ncbi:sigma-70 family RNA polymerase sigma factor [Streptomyces sp. NPDC048717]|uniref:RNA polymerase sigma factor n=1 Tax=Streptomyces sp. NPDC048717 TaxID=3154928 RepID=UPI003446FA24
MAAETLILHRKMGNQLSFHACQDIAHEAFLRVTRRAIRGQLGPDVNLPAYLRTASRNLAVDALRAQARFTPLEETGLVAAVPGQRQAADDLDPLEELVVPAIDAMPRTRERKVVQLQSQGLDDTEISRVLGIGADRVYRDRYKALIALRRALRKHIRAGHRKKTTRRVEDR